MRIGIEAQRLFREKKHGMDIVALETIRHLQKIDKTNEYFIFVKPDKDNGVISTTSNFKIIPLPGGPYPYWEQVLLPKAARKHNIDVLHCTSNTAPLNPGVPLVVTLHDIIYLEQWNFTRGTYYQIFGNLYRRWNVPPVVSKASRLITVSDFEKERIIKHFGLPQGKIATVHNGVSSHFSRVTDETVINAVRKKYHLPENFVFFLGNTDPKKNLEGVLRALSALRNKGALNFHLVMLDVDRGYLEKVSSTIGDPAILSNIVSTGYVPNHELPAIYSMAQLFLYPSLRESFGIPILEAMACGTPVITSQTSSMPEVAGDAAILVDPGSPDSIAAAISSILGDPVLSTRLSDRGLLRSKQFSWSENARKTLDIYLSVGGSS